MLRPIRLAKMRGIWAPEDDFAQILGSCHGGNDPHIVGRCCTDRVEIGYSGTDYRKAASSMPNKHNAARRHHISKMKFRVKNWAEYDAALRGRGSLTLWVTPEVLDGWQAARRTTPGGQSIHSELAIETGMMLRLAFHLALRQTEGLMGSIFGLLGVQLSAPYHSTLSRRASKMTSFSKGCSLPEGPVHLLIDSTGLKVFGAGEWLQEKHGVRARRTWKKLHLAVDADTGMVTDGIDSWWPRQAAESVYSGVGVRSGVPKVSHKWGNFVLCWCGWQTVWVLPLKIALQFASKRERV